MLTVPERSRVRLPACAARKTPTIGAVGGIPSPTSGLNHWR